MAVPSLSLPAAYAGETECWACGATVRVPLAASSAGALGRSSASGAPAPAFYCGWCRAVNGTIPRRQGRGRAGLGQALNA